MTRLVVFDVCHTLIDANTTHVWLKHLFATDARRRLATRAIVSSRSPLRPVLALAARVGQGDRSRAALLGLTGGLSIEALAAAGESAAAALLEHNRIDAVWRRLEMHARAGDALALVSSSFTHVVAPIASEVGAIALASRLAYDANGRSTGVIEADLTHHKHEAVAAMRQERELVVYSDNRTDLPLMRRASEAHAVANSAADARWWREQLTGAEIIDVGDRR